MAGLRTITSRTVIFASSRILEDRYCPWVYFSTPLARVHLMETNHQINDAVDATRDEYHGLHAERDG